MATPTSLNLNALKAHCLSAAESIYQECTAALTTTTPNPDDSDLTGCEEPLIQLLQRQAHVLSSLYSNPPTPARDEARETQTEEQERNRQIALLLRRLDDLAAVAYGKFYAYLFRDLPVCWRVLYTDACILKFCVVFLGWEREREGGSCWDGEMERVERGSGRGRGDGMMPLLLDEMVGVLDLALILAGGAGEKRGRGWIERAFGLVEEVWRVLGGGDGLVGLGEVGGGGNGDGRPMKRRRMLEGVKGGDREMWEDTPSFSAAEPFTPPVRCPVHRVGMMTMEEFQEYLSRPREKDRGPEPLIISGLVDEWPARTSHPWNKPAYLLSRTLDGRRLVPVEIGRSYVDEGWSQKIIPFGKFLHDYIDPSLATNIDIDKTPPPPESEHERKPQIAYLAQHQLLTQLPLLRNDILIPNHCYTLPPLHPTDPTQDQPELDSPQLNAWFGPPGTITPLHTDPYHNLLAQVVGRKYVRLYAPWETGRMRARGKEGGVEMGNTSAVDVGVVEGWDDDIDQGEEVEVGEQQGWGDEDEFRKVPYLECILEEGDTLYIPIGWWHYVRGLSVSFSVSFWWN